MLVKNFLLIIICLQIKDISDRQNQMYYKLMYFIVGLNTRVSQMAAVVDQLITF